MGQRSQKDQISFFNAENQDQLLKLVEDPTKEVRNIEILSDRMVQATWRDVDAFVRGSSQVNVVTACEVTAQARLKLYNLISRLGSRTFYFDTDSCIYLSQGNVREFEPQKGSKLGELADELAVYGPGSYITTFVSSGPKSYAYKVFSPSSSKTHTVCKVKGIRLNYTAQKHVNFESMLRLVNSFVKYGVSPDFTLYFPQIDRLHDRTLVTRIACKRFRVVYDKRIVRRDFHTVPYGYCDVDTIHYDETENTILNLLSAGL